MKAIYKTTVGALIVVSLTLFIFVLLGVLARMHDETESATGMPVTVFKAPGVRCFVWRGQFSCTPAVDEPDDVPDGATDFRRPHRSAL
ncbi:TPA: hypothetical protein QDC22_007520 [Burkholderia stabilis]|nr:hypothetical protein [Burkholderia stabilis]HDR9589131.1 hypothetical protein [Burkholderia stabilis]HDR9649527.1 hypothetical protein [Burkholderia stabilis]HDR9653593.1 hypothetical protein [Burkholderia stabilis]HDR9656288.1 hypothetical protein [Burkholderia stabilis]